MTATLRQAITVHRAQGMTLDAALVDLRGDAFAPGLGYVALSRVRSLAGLYVDRFSPGALWTSGKVLAFYDALERGSGAGSSGQRL